LPDRVHDRVPVSIEVEYRTAGAFLVAYTSNLSKGGLFIETDHPAPIGTDLVLRFTIPGAGPIEVRGSVAWVRPEAMEGKNPGMGVEFEQLDARHGQVVDEIVGSFKGLQILVASSGFQARAQLARSVRSILSTAEVVEASNSDAAEAALAREPDLAIVDVDDHDAAEGLYILRRAKTAVARALPVIALARDDDVRSRARELGADEVLVAPLVLPDLQASILRALGRPLRIG
jgi:uncharacterized protein (TIGR02266 family)